MGFIVLKENCVLSQGPHYLNVYPHDASCSSVGKPPSEVHLGVSSALNVSTVGLK